MKYIHCIVYELCFNEVVFKNSFLGKSDWTRGMGGRGR